MSFSRTVNYRLRRASFAVSAMGFLSLLALALVPQLMPSYSFAADTPTVNPSISIGNSGIIALTAQPGVFSSAGETVTVATSNYTGYTLTLEPSSGSSTDLAHSSGANYVISTISLPAGEDSITSSSFPDTGYGISTDSIHYIPVTSGMTIKSTGASGTDNITLAMGAKVATTVPSGTYERSFTLTATANAPVYRVQFDKNTTDAVNIMPTTQESGSVSGTALILPTEAPTRNNYTFLGWSTDSNATTATYQPGGLYNLDLTTENAVTLYAIWEHNVVTCSKQYRLQNADGSYPSSYTADGSEEVEIGATCSYTKSATNYTTQSTSGTAGSSDFTLSVSLPRTTYTCSKQYRLQNADGSYPSSWTSGGSETLRWGQTCSYSQSATNYTTQSTSETMSTANKTLQVSLPRTTYTCSKQYRLQNADGSYGSWTNDGSETLRWGQTCSYSKSATNYTTQSTSDTMSTANKTLQVSLPRTTYTCSKQYRLQNADGSYGSWTNDGSETLRWGQTCSYSKSVSYYTTQSTSAAMSTANKTLQVSLPRTTYTLTINRNTTYISSVSGAGTYRWGQSVSISATAASNSAFNGWSLSSGTAGTFANANNASTTFTMGKGNATIYANGKDTRTYMQNFTASQCSSSCSSGNCTVYDSRDSKSYTVRYINGYCWMTSDLKFTGTSLNTSTSDVSTNKNITWLDGSSNCKNTDKFTAPTAACKHEYNGYIFYNIVAASAMSLTTGPYNWLEEELTESICPAGWTLPSKDQFQALGGTNYCDGTGYNKFTPSITAGAWYFHTNSPALNGVTYYRGRSRDLRVESGGFDYRINALYVTTHATGTGCVNYDPRVSMASATTGILIRCIKK